MNSISKEIIKITEDFHSHYIHLDEEITSFQLAEDKWSLKQIIGHLIDSASNNHQRFIRLQLQDNITFSDYDKDEWLSLEKHNLIPYKTLLDLLANFNSLLAHLIANIDPDTLQNKWIVDWDENTNYMTLEKLIEHYLWHLKYHIGHFVERLNEINDREIGR